MEYIGITLISHFVELLLLLQKSHLVIKLTKGGKIQQITQPWCFKELVSGGL